MFGLIGKMTATPGNRDSLIAILLEGTRSMPGCLSYVIAKDDRDGDVIWVTEVWDSKESHEASLRLPPVRDAIAKGRPLIASLDAVASTEPAGGEAPPHRGPAEHPTLDQINVVTGDFAESLTFYRGLGVSLPAADVAENDGVPFHTHARVSGGAHFDLDSPRFARVWNRGWEGRDDLSGRVLVTFRYRTRDEVDARYDHLTAAGYRGLQGPHDAFWGARFAIVEAPEGVAVGLMSPAEEAFRSALPDF